MAAPGQKDIIVLVPDLDIAATIGGLFRRHQSLQIRPVEPHIVRHLQRDAGCRTGAVEFLRPFCNQYRYTMILFDLEGSGAEQWTAAGIESKMEKDLAKNGWKDRCAVIVIDPELEIWVWGGSNRIAELIGWQGREPDLRTWMNQKGLLPPDRLKPSRPKEAYEEALRTARKPPSSFIFKVLAENVGFGACTDRSFVKFRQTVKAWFGSGD